MSNAGDSPAKPEVAAAKGSSPRLIHRLESLLWGPFEGIGPDLIESVWRLKSRAGHDLVLRGCSTPTSTLLAHGLADEVLLIVHPVLVGTGKRFFADGTPGYAFELVSTKTTPSRPCGDLDTARRRQLPSISDRYAASISAAINRRFCTAAPAAPLPRLSRTAPKTI